MSLIPFFSNQISHFSEGVVSVREEVSHLTIFVVDVVEQVPLDIVILVVSVAVDGGAEVVGDVSQLVGLEPDQKH